MNSFITKRNWWIVLVVATILSFGLAAIAKWFPDYGFVAFVLVAIILGLAFYWVYTIDKEELWWALIPALSMVVLLAVAIVASVTPKDASGSSPYGVVTLGLGAAVIGLILKRPTAKFVLYAIAAITLLVGILMLPLDLIWKIVLIVLDILLVGFLMGQTARQMPKTTRT